MLTAVARRELSLAQMPANKAARGFATRAADLGFGPLHLRATKGLFSHVHATFRRSFPRLTRLFGVPKLGVAPFSFLRAAFQSTETIQQRMSFSTRTSLSQPMRAAGIPRSPTMARPVHEVGLGTVRKFSSQTTFKHVAENVSITGRAFWSADWDVDESKKRARLPKCRRTRHHRDDEQSKRRHRIAAMDTSNPFIDNLSQMSVYFQYAPPAVTTLLQIALASTPTATLPLSAHDEETYIIPLRSILNNQTAFQATADDISAIFAKLDESDVWSRGVSIDTWGDTNGLCVELRIRFAGWSEHDVRTLLGQLVERPACALQEVYDQETPPIGNIASHTHLPTLDAPLDFIMPSVHTPHTQAHFQSTRPVTPSSEPAVSEFGSDLVSEGLVTSVISSHSSSWDDTELLSPTFESVSQGLHLTLSAAFISRVQSLDSIRSG